MNLPMPGAEHAGTEYRVLILENNVNNVESVLQELHRAQINVVPKIAASRDGFLCEIKKARPHVVVSNFKLPVFSALEALKIMKEENITLPFVVLTDAESDEASAECLKAGADDCVNRQSLKHLPTAFRNALAKHEAELKRDRAERELHHRATLYRMITENTHDLICLLDEEGRFIHATPSYEKILGYDPKELLGLDALSFIHPDDLERMKSLLQEARFVAKDVEGEYRFKHKDGQWRIIESNGKWILDEEGIPRSLVVVSRDVTDKKELESEFRQSQKMESLGRLASGIAHDFNNLLTAISGYSDLMGSKLKSDDPLRQDVEGIREMVYRASTLTRQLLLFSRKQLPVYSIVNLNAVVMRSEKVLKRLLGEKIELTVHLDHDLKPIRFDPGHMEQVLLNLAVNARDAMASGGKLTVRTSNERLPEGNAASVPPGDYVVLTVGDTGCGMDEATLARIFEPFFTTKPYGEGTGLGLSTVKSIVKDAGGEIRAQSRKGEGAVMTIYLPPSPEAVPEKPDMGVRSRSLKGTETVLAVEDDEAVRNVLCRALHLQGYKVLEARNGEEALQKAEASKKPVDFLLTDVVMPNLDGPELAARLRQNTPHLRVLYISGYTDSKVKMGFEKERGASFMAKPFRTADLLRRVRDVLDETPA